MSIPLYYMDINILYMNKISGVIFYQYHTEFGIILTYIYFTNLNTFSCMWVDRPENFLLFPLKVSSQLLHHTIVVADVSQLHDFLSVGGLKHGIYRHSISHLFQNWRVNLGIVLIIRGLWQHWSRRCILGFHLMDPVLWVGQRVTLMLQMPWV